MTSKAIIQKQIKLTKIVLKENENVFSEEMAMLYKKDLEYYNQVLKDLEILEILKKKAYFYSINKNPKVASIEIHITTLDDNFNEVEEWLENDK